MPRRLPAARRTAPPAPATRRSTSARSRLANVDLGASLGQRTIGSRRLAAAEVQFSDSYDGGALGNVSVKLLPSNAASKPIRTTSVPILWNPDVGDMTSATRDGPIYRFDKGLMDAVRNDPGHGPTIGAYAHTRQQGCGDAQAQVPPVASHVQPGEHAQPVPAQHAHDELAHHRRADGIPPSPAGDGQPGYNALFADTPYGFVADAVDGRRPPGLPVLRPGALALLTGSRPASADADRHERRLPGPRGAAPADGVPARLLGPGADRQPEDAAGRPATTRSSVPTRRRSRTRRSRPATSRSRRTCAARCCARTR